MKTSESIAEIADALAAARAAITPPSKVHTAGDGKFRYEYATLGDTLTGAAPALSANGLALVQEVGPLEMRGEICIVTVTGRLIHASGEWIEAVSEMPVDTPDPQRVGSATTYARRYQLWGLLNLAAVDDDGASAMPAARQRETVSETMLAAIEERGTEAYGDDGFFAQTVRLALWKSNGRTDKISELYAAEASDLLGWLDSDACRQDAAQATGGPK